MSTPAVPAGIMEGRGALATYLWETEWVPFDVLWNSTGQPAASVPAGFSADGLPLAVQLVGRRTTSAPCCRSPPRSRPRGRGQTAARRCQEADGASLTVRRGGETIVVRDN